MFSSEHVVHMSSVIEYCGLGIAVKQCALQLKS